MAEFLGRCLSTGECAMSDVSDREVSEARSNMGAVVICGFIVAIGFIVMIMIAAHQREQRLDHPDQCWLPALSIPIAGDAFLEFCQRKIVCGRKW
jgi:hypothetical protein